MQIKTKKAVPYFETAFFYIKRMNLLNDHFAGYFICTCGYSIEINAWC